MPLVLYNSFSKKDEVFQSLKSGEVTMYTCGPTVYGRPHIGNYSSFLMADVLRRWLEVSGYTVRHVKNITDVGHLVADAEQGEDKIEKQAQTEHVDPLVIAEKYTKQYLDDEKMLKMLEPYARPKATETIVEQIAIIRELMAHGHAYETEDGIYFAVETFAQYGKLSGNTLDQLDLGARVEKNERKRHPADFALWKKTVGVNAHHVLRWSLETGQRVMTTGEDASVGFPGWHIECSAMSRLHLGYTIDIHTGGEDNIFPHHECEIAQSECSGSHPFVRYWLHKRRIEMAMSDDTAKTAERAEGVKMSKSLGNVLSIDDVLARGYDAMDLRYLLLSVHYRTRLKFHWKGMDDAKKARRKISEWMEEMMRKCEQKTGVAEGDGKEQHTKAAECLQQFQDAMNHDLNTSAALAVIFDAMSASKRVDKLSKMELHEYRLFIEMVRQTFGCFDPVVVEVDDVPSAVIELLTRREQARSHKDFAESDRLRAQIYTLGYAIDDTSSGAKLKKRA